MKLNSKNKGWPLVLALWVGFSFNSSVLSAELPAKTAPEPQDTGVDPLREGSTLPVASQQSSSFDLFELRVKGSTKLDKKQLERTLYPFLGPKKSLETVDQARIALEELYKAQGYQIVTVDIPEQDVKNGVVYLQVVEGKISRLKVKDARFFSMGAIKAGVPELAEGSVPHFPTMQKQLAALGSESSDRKIQPVLRAGDTPGTLEVDLKVKDEMPLHGKVELNGRNNASTSRLRLVSSLHYDNLWQAMHSASFTYQVSPENSDEVDVMAGTYALPLFNTDMKLSMYGVKSSSNSQIANAGSMTVIGTGEIFGARLIKPFNAVGNYNHSVIQGIDYKSYQENLFLQGSDTNKTPIEYMPFMTQYNGSIRGEQSFTSFDLTLNYSLRGFGNDQQQFENKRLKANANYMFLSSDVKVQHDLPYGMEVKTHFTGRVSDSPLISNEQYSLGGAFNVRGYYETQALADSGVFGSVELYSPNLGEIDEEYFNNLKLMTFLDAGKGWILAAQQNNPNEYSLASGGAGLNFHIKKYLIAALDVGFPFIPFSTGSAPIKEGDPRIDFSVATEF